MPSSSASPTAHPCFSSTNHIEWSVLSLKGTQNRTLHVRPLSSERRITLDLPRCATIQPCLSLPRKVPMESMKSGVTVFTLGWMTLRVHVLPPSVDRNRAPSSHAAHPFRSSRNEIAHTIGGRVTKEGGTSTLSVLVRFAGRRSTRRH